ncbi:Gfo/Idh/MocA family protein [Aeromicrobium sp. UC242_57]|uniref:Gfo/Idh/MocA family protein n=1 Tax=Aeromicrobium sp. UC242_57 TaxID=3374624 RepID=UPI0037BADB84
MPPTRPKLIASRDVDAVIIASPDFTHADLTKACFAAGKPVLCEKPLAVTAADALSVVEAEVALGRRLLQVGFMRRYDPGFGRDCGAPSPTRSSATSGSSTRCTAMRPAAPARVMRV